MVGDSTDGNKTYEQVVSSLDEATRERCHRLDQAFIGYLPPLNATCEMDEIIETMKVMKSEMRAQIDDIYLVLLSSSFYFELSHAPVYSGMHMAYSCEGQVRIRGQRSLILDQMPASTTIHVDSGEESLASVELRRSVCMTCGAFHQPIRFLIRDLTRSVSISLGLDNAERKCISGFPTSMQWIANVQQFDGPFSSLIPTYNTSACEPVSQLMRNPHLKRKAADETSVSTRKRSKVGCFR